MGYTLLRKNLSILKCLLYVFIQFAEPSPDGYADSPWSASLPVIMLKTLFFRA